MTFWNAGYNEGKGVEPKRNFRFKINSDGWGDQSVWWWAKSIDKPSFNISNNEYQLINHKFKYPGIVTWNNIQMTVVDIAGNGPNGNDSLEFELFKLGYSRPDEGAMKGIEKFSSRGKTVSSNLQIQHLNADGAAVDTWTLKGAFIVSVSYSKLDYSDDAISEITIEIAYDYADYEGLPTTKAEKARAKAEIEIPGDPNYQGQLQPFQDPGPVNYEERGDAEFIENPDGTLTYLGKRSVKRRDKN